MNVQVLHLDELFQSGENLRRAVNPCIHSHTCMHVAGTHTHCPHNFFQHAPSALWNTTSSKPLACTIKTEAKSAATAAQLTHYMNLTSCMVKNY